MSEEVSASFRLESHTSAQPQVMCLPGHFLKSTFNCIMLLETELKIRCSGKDGTIPPHSFGKESKVLVVVDGYRPIENAYLAEMLRRLDSERIGLCSDNWTFQKICDCLRRGIKNIFLLPHDLSSLREFVKLPPKQLQTHHVVHETSTVRQAHFDTLKTLLARRILQGCSAKEIGRELGISVRTVHLRKREFFHEFGCTNRNELIHNARFHEFASGTSNFSFEVAQHSSQQFQTCG